MDEEMKAPDAAIAPPSAPVATATSSDEKRFEIKKWNAVALWSWGAFSFSFLFARREREREISTESGV